MARFGHKLKPRGTDKISTRGAGKPAGTRSTKTLRAEEAIAAALKAAAAALGDSVIEKMTPLDVMLYAMRISLKNGWVFKAAEVADKCAPYVHAKLTSTTLDDKRRRSPAEFSDEELFALAGSGVSIEGDTPTELGPNDPTGFHTIHVPQLSDGSPSPIDMPET